MDTADALGKLGDVQRLHSRLYSHISETHGEEVAQQYVDAVFEADDDIVPLIPPASWDEIMDSFVNGLNGRISNYQDLTFTHAISAVLEKNAAQGSWSAGCQGWQMG